jgi:hypothetical protein
MGNFEPKFKKTVKKILNTKVIVYLLNDCFVFEAKY